MEWKEKGGRINPKNDRLCDNIRQNIYDEFPNDPAFAEKLMPSWPPFAKRLVVDNGWFDALKEPHVSLVTEGIDRITDAGIVTKDGVLHDLDLIVLAGGFKTERYLWPVQYRGSDGITLEQAWEHDGARAYLGVTMPDFPNMFIVYGPNMNPRAGGLFAWLEIWARYAVQAIAHMIEGGHRRIECRRDNYTAYNQRLDDAQGSCIWAMDGIKSYYISEQGRQIVNNPLRPSETYNRVRNFEPSDYNLR
jgi:4-hydroxyacetophenone monooxygenase